MQSRAATIIAHWVSNLTARQLAERFGVSEGYIRNIARKSGLTYMRAKGPKRGGFDWARLPLTEMSVDDIVRASGRTRARVYQKLRQLGLRARK